MFQCLWSEETHPLHCDSRVRRRLQVQLVTFHLLEASEVCFLACNVYLMLLGILLLLSFSWSSVYILSQFWKSTAAAPPSVGVALDGYFDHCQKLTVSHPLAVVHHWLLPARV